MWKSKWTSWAPVPNKPTVSVDVKQHFIISPLSDKNAFFFFTPAFYFARFTGWCLNFVDTPRRTADTKSVSSERVISRFRVSSAQSSGAAWESRWPSLDPVPNKPTVSVDVKQHWTALWRHALLTTLLRVSSTIGGKETSAKKVFRPYGLCGCETALKKKVLLAWFNDHIPEQL